MDNWLAVAPGYNPGLTEMFARGQNGENDELVDWAGEFAGKYLISGVQALRMSNDPALLRALHPFGEAKENRQVHKRVHDREQRAEHGNDKTVWHENTDPCGNTARISMGQTMGGAVWFCNSFKSLYPMRTI